MTRAASLGLALLLGLWAPASASAAPTVDHARMGPRLERLDAETPGVLGACVADRRGVSCVNGDRPMPMQSVMKLPLAIAVLDAADRGVLSLQDEVTVRREDLSVFVQPIAELVGPDGHRTTVADLLERSLTQSDNAATDVLIGRLGGPAAVQAVLDGKGVTGVRVDRDERHLQTEILGLAWKPEYVDPKALQAAIQAVPPERRDAALEAYRQDVRDTATARGMTALLLRLGRGELLSPASTRWLLQVLERTSTFPDRLRAGAPEGWTVAHKTGTSGAWRGVTAATNDVGLLRSPDGELVAVAAFLADSPDDPAGRSKVIADVARTVAAP